MASLATHHGTEMHRRNPQIAIILSDDAAIISRLESRLGVTRKEVVDFYIEVAMPQEFAALRGGGGTGEERLCASRDFLGKPGGA